MQEVVVCPASAFFPEAVRAFERAALKPIVRHYSIGDRVWRLEFAGSALFELLSPALEHLAVPEQAHAVRVRLFDSESTGVPMPAPPWGQDGYGPRGEIEGSNNDDFFAVFQQGVDILHLYDVVAGESIYWTPTWRAIPYWERSFPLRSVIHRWSAHQEFQPIHAGAVGTDGEGVLIVGRGGSGKSTSTLACLEGGLQYAGDDYVLLETGEAPKVHSLYGTAKLVPDNLHRFPRLQSLVANADRLDEEKALLFLGGSHGGQLVRQLAIRAILIPCVTGLRDSTLVKTTPMAGALAIAPTTILQLLGDSHGVMRKVSGLARQVPTYQLRAGTDLPQIPRLIADLLKGTHGAAD